MGEITGIFIIGFIVWGIYKTAELLVRKKERLMFIEKLFTHCETKGISGSFQMPPILFENQNSGSWSLRFALLLIGVGLGCLLAFFTLYYLKNTDYHVDYSTKGLINFSYISIFGGIGLLISYLIESNQSKKQQKQ